MRILVADDHAVVRRGVCDILRSRPDLHICGEAHDGLHAIEQAQALRPDLVILDVNMPNLDGFAAARKIKAALPETRILMLSMHDNSEMIRLSKSMDLQGFVSKGDVSEALLAAIDAISAGGTFFPVPAPVPHS